MKYWYTNLKNNIDFFIRSHIIFSRKNYTETGVNVTGVNVTGVNNAGGNIENVFINDEQKDLYFSLKEKYDLTPLYKYNDINFLTNLYYLDIFDKYILPDKKPISVLDIGSKNWNYAGSEHVFFKKFSDDLLLDGIELDAYRLCTNLYTRYEISKFYTKELENANYHAGDFMEHNRKYDYIIWILPFITEYPHLRWGLPLKYFNPEKMLGHAFELLNEGGELLIMNQGENEYNIQKDLNNQLKLKFEDIGEVNNIFSPFKNRRFCTIVKKYN